MAQGFAQALQAGICFRRDGRGQGPGVACQLPEQHALFVFQYDDFGAEHGRVLAQLRRFGPEPCQLFLQGCEGTVVVNPAVAKFLLYGCLGDAEGQVAKGQCGTPPVSTYFHYYEDLYLVYLQIEIGTTGGGEG